MKLLLVLCVFIASSIAAPSEEVELLYAIDFDAIADNPTEREAVFDCLLEKAPCGDRQIFRDSAIKVYKNQCADCNAEQKKKYDHVVKRFRTEHEDVYNEFVKKIS